MKKKTTISTDIRLNIEASKRKHDIYHWWMPSIENKYYKKMGRDLDEVACVPYLYMGSVIGITIVVYYWEGNNPQRWDAEKIIFTSKERELINSLPE